MKRCSVRSLARVAIGAAIMAVSAWIAVPLGPVAVTLQVLSLFLLAGLLPPPEALVSVLLYECLGVIGLPVFSSFQGGVGVLVGPTGGFLLAMLPAVFVLSVLLHRRRPVLPVPAIFLLGSLIIDLGGLCSLVLISGFSLSRAVAVGIVPFVLPDLAKIAVASLLLTRLRTAIRRTNP